MPELNSALNKVNLSGLDMSNGLHTGLRTSFYPRTPQKVGIFTPLGGTGKLFVKNRETIDETLTRKFKEKYLSKEQMEQEQVSQLKKMRGQSPNPEDASEKPAVSALSTFIEAEVKRFLASNRLNELALRDLDGRIHMEAFLREKRDAIDQDRREGTELTDVQSHTSVVQ